MRHLPSSSSSLEMNCQALYFCGLEASKKVLPANNPVASFAGGVLAQLCGSVIWVPMDVVKERLQVQVS